MTLDKEKLIKYTDFFTERVLKANQYLHEKFPNQEEYYFQSNELDFHAGFISMEEGYKNSAISKQEQYLHVALWDDDAIMDGTVAKEICKLIYDNKLNNLIDWRDKTFIKTLLEDESKRKLIGNCIRGIFRGDDNKARFQDAQRCIGDKFPIISYLYFIKDPEHYLPVRPNNFAEKFQLVGISEWRSCCSWDNYMDFISAITEVQDFLKKRFNDESISLLDAHSFVWMAWMDDFSEEGFFVEIEKHCKEELRKQERARKSYKKKAETIESEIQCPDGKEREAVVRLRVNQGVFRSLLLEKYDRCCLCQIRNRGLLSASHIKPWSASTSTEKLDWNNGFLMCPNHDRLFDKGFISFSDDGSIMISDNLSEIDRLYTNIRSDMSINIKLTEGNKRYLQYHRENVYQGPQYTVM